MSYLSYDKKELVNLEYSLNKEVLRTNRAGSFALSTIICSNTRKYHGLLICPIPQFGDKRHVLLSSFDESIFVNKEYNFGIHRYAGGVYSPKGHKYIEDFYIDNVAGLVYKVGDVRFRKEYIMIDKSEQLLIKYTLEDCNNPVTFRFRPFTAFRSIHALSKANLDVNTKVNYIKNGISYKMYDGFPDLNMQFSKPVDYIHVPNWYYNIEYTKEQERGYDYHEDLMVPGYFELTLKKGETIIFSASTKEENPANLKTQFAKQAEQRVERNCLEDCLINAGNQFFVKKGNFNVFMYAGYPWHGIRGRSTFIAMPGLVYATKVEDRFEQVIDTMLKYIKHGMFPNLIVGDVAIYNAADISLWFIRAIQLTLTDVASKDLWIKYGKEIKEVLAAYKNGMEHNIKMQDNYLIYAGGSNEALTWMDSVIDETPVTPRSGYQVEVNALWYNAICYALHLAKSGKDTQFIQEWENMPDLIQASFIANFWNDTKGYCADYFTEYNHNWEVRPNMIIASSLPYSPLTQDMKKSILNITQKELLTPKGLRTLSPKSPNYEGQYKGTSAIRKKAAHQGSVWPWLLEPYYATYLNIYGDPRQEYAKKLLANFEEDIKEHGIGSISEIYEGNPPHQATGAISYACSVGALLRIKNMHLKKKKQ